MTAIPHDAAASPSRDSQQRFLWLGAGALLSLFAVGGRWDIPLAAWLFSIFLLRFVRTSRVLPGVGLVWLVSIASALFWVWQVAVPVVPATYVACLAFGTVFTLPYLLDRLLTPRLSGTARLLLFPAALAACEFFMGTFSPLGAAYGLLAATQRANLPLLQVISVLGPYAIGFLIGALATVANHAWEQDWSWQRSRRIATIYAAVLGVVLMGGEARIAFFPVSHATTVRIAGISPSRGAAAPLFQLIGGQASRDEDAARTDPAAFRAASGIAIAELLASTRRAAQAGAKIVLWSENAATVLAADEPALLAAAAALAKEEQIYLSVADKVYLPEAPYGRDETHLIGPDGAVLWTYRKARPIPGLETYIPGGAPATVVDTPYGRLANVICYDADFPAVARIDADILLVPGGDWPEIGRVHTGMASLRAIENGYALVRQDFIGLSAAFDHQGHVLAAQDTTGPDAYVMLADVPTKGVATLYRTTGDLFAWACLAAVLALAGLAIVRPRAVS
ncbi:Apolipoprotein N-acyltransferase [Alphaproteobacteria bacterium SO-S41]|nr:Apolipoprotein N-acyltransferase [Alphaproteobacteria bacterium SO-S41]